MEVGAIVGLALGLKCFCVITVGYLWMECRQRRDDRIHPERVVPLWGDDQSTWQALSRRGSSDDPDSCLVVVDTERTEEPSAPQ